MFALRNVVKRFGTRRVLDDLSLTIPPGRTTVLLGPSGCGKSTLLRLLLGLLTPDEGTVQFDGGPIERTTRHRFGYVVQEGGLFPHLTATGNASLLARHLGWSRDRWEQRVRELADLARLPIDGLSRYPSELSGGQRQRVGLMRALMLDPKVLLLDEPLGALDPITRAELQRDLKEIFTRLSKTVVLVTHDLAEAAYFADDVVLLNDGRIAQRGGLGDLIRAPADPFVTRFVDAQRGPWEALREASR
jgi:osmoprotectant transport system ATP-binding protein